VELLRLAYVGLDGQAPPPGFFGEFLGCLGEALDTGRGTVRRCSEIEEMRDSLAPQNDGVSAIVHLHLRQLDILLTRAGHTMDSVIALQMPEPPPVQKSTLPLNMSGLKVAARSGGGCANDVDAMVV
jgi:hypothetical protein